MSEVIWNGLGVTTPADWEPVAIERDGLTFASGDRPVCELKWNRIHGSFSFDKHIKRLTKGNKSAGIVGVPEDETPAAWTTALTELAESGIRSKSFLWQTDTHRGMGAALHNPGLGLAALVQFFIYTDEDENLAAEVLASVRDYSQGKSLPWAMFGLTGRVPAEFLLSTFSFKPGHYRVEYWRPKSGKQSGKMPHGKGPGTHLVFERFAPASVVLRETDLASWVAENIDQATEDALVEHDGGVEWDNITKTNLLRKALRREVQTLGRVWTTDTGNAILSVVTHGVVPAPEPIFNEICESYSLVQEETA